MEIPLDTARKYIYIHEEIKLTFSFLIVPIMKKKNIYMKRDNREIIFNRFSLNNLIE